VRLRVTRNDAHLIAEGRVIRHEGDGDDALGSEAIDAFVDDDAFLGRSGQGEAQEGTKGEQAHDGKDEEGSVRSLT
jgi:hypothetical protein